MTSLNWQCADDLRFYCFRRTFSGGSSLRIFSAFCKGLERLGLKEVDSHKKANVWVIWSLLWGGKMVANKKFWDLARKKKVPVLVLDVGAIERGKTWKIAVNGLGKNCYFAPQDTGIRRFPAMIRARKWKPREPNILICLQNETSELWSGMPNSQAWLESIVPSIRQYSDRPIVVRPHPRFPIRLDLGCLSSQGVTISQYPAFIDDLLLSHYVLNWSSTASVGAAMKGIPVWTGPDSMASAISQPLEFLEQTPRHDLNAWLEWLSWTEWTEDELRSGFAMEFLMMSPQPLHLAAT
ncbi:MAG: hypothetical protein ACO3HS_03480 [Burkholderiaceae bacterium]